MVSVCSILRVIGSDSPLLWPSCEPPTISDRFSFFARSFAASLLAPLVDRQYTDVPRTPLLLQASAWILIKISAPYSLAIFPLFFKDIK